MQEPIRLQKGDDGIVTLVFDAPEQAVNTMSDAMRQCLASITQELERDKDQFAGVILASSKDTFFAGGDLRRLYNMQPKDAQLLFEATQQGKAALRRLEKLGKPVVAALNGTALGGGFEIALSCHRRIALRKPKVQFGFPEATLGLMPGAGGVARLTRMLGLEKSQPHLQDSKLLSAQEALQAGLIDELVDTVEQMMERARAWIRDNPAPLQPWDRPGYAPPGGLPNEGESVRSPRQVQHWKCRLHTA